MKQIIKFGAEWCGPCKAMKPQIEKFRELIQDSDVEVLEFDIDVEENSIISMEYGVRSIPYTVFLEDGKVKKSLVGMKTSVELYDTFKEVYELK